jgi:predicted nucleic acid-binding protein
MNGMTKICFDTCAAVNLVDEDRSVTEILADFEGSYLFMSVVARIEFLSKPNMKAEELTKREEFVDAVKLIPLNQAIQDETIKLRRAHHLKTPDAIIAATAALLGATLLTADDHFDGPKWPGFSMQRIE